MSLENIVIYDLRCVVAVVGHTANSDSHLDQTQASPPLKHDIIDDDHHLCALDEEFSIRQS